MENINIINRFSNKVAHLFGQYYRSLKRLNVLPDDQILCVIKLIFSVSFYRKKSTLFSIIKEDFKLASRGQYKIENEVFDLELTTTNATYLTKEFLISMIIQTIINFPGISHHYSPHLIEKVISTPTAIKELTKYLDDGLNGILYKDSLSEEEINNHINDIFTLKELVDLISIFKFFSAEGEIRVSYKKEDIKDNLIIINENEKLDLINEFELKEQFCVCALCNGSVTNETKHKDVSFSMAYGQMKQTDLFATGPEVNFTNKHFICFDCAIKRFIPIQLLIDQEILSENDIKNINRKNLVNKIDDIILKAIILKHMPYDNKIKREILLANLDD